MRYKLATYRRFTLKIHLKSVFFTLKLIQFRIQRGLLGEEP